MGKLKSVEEILKDMGFNPESKESTQFALYRHLKKASTPPIKAEVNPEPIQLEFDFDGPRSGSLASTAKKISNR